jgi:hypothetical protein
MSLVVGLKLNLEVVQQVLGIGDMRKGCQCWEWQCLVNDAERF